MGVFDLEERLAFHGAHHNNPINVLIHSFLVLPIFFTFLLLLRFTPSLYDFSGTGLLPYGMDCALVFNLGFLYTVTGAVFYVGLDKRAGSFAAFLFVLAWIGVSFVATSLGFHRSLKIILPTQMLCGIAQIIGHQVFEKRAPSFLSSFLPTIMSVPFFGLLEVLERALDYEPYPGFRTRVKAKIDANIKEWQYGEQKKIA